MSYLLAILGAYWLALSINALLPRYRPPLLAAISFFPAWLHTEQIPARLVLQGVAVAALWALGATEQPVGWLGVGLCGGAWILMVGSLRESLRAPQVTARAWGDAQAGPGRGKDEKRPTDSEAPLLSAPFGEAWVPWPRRPAGVQRRRGIPYRVVDEARLSMDVIRLQGDARPAAAPALVFIHGGGWVIGHKDKQGLPLMYRMARQGWVCFAPSYRLSPAARLPQMVEDLEDALRWIREHAEEHGVDPGFIAVAGGSAGGHLAALLALTAPEPSLQPGLEEADTRVQACVPFYGIYDLVDAPGIWPHGGLQRLLERHVIGQSRRAAGALYEQLSPMYRLHAGAPPFCIFHGALDNLAPAAGARRFAERLRQVSREPVIYTEYPGAHHAFEVFPSFRSLAAVEGAARFLTWVRARALENPPADRYRAG